MSLPREGRIWLVWWFCWLAWLGLLMQQLADLVIYGYPWIFWVGKLLPLLMFLPGMLNDRLRSFIWLCFVCLLYFIALVERLFAMPGNTLAICGMLAVVTLFCCAMLYVRWRARAIKAQLAASLAKGD
ncbi:MAG: DUF2069 domain-containing protein [Parahaliea sp.]